MRRLSADKVGYAAILAVSFALATAGGWLGGQIDNYAYDAMFRRHRPKLAPSQCILLTADEASLRDLGGLRRLRQYMAEGLERVASAQPRVVAVDFILADEGDPEEDRRLESALRRLPRLVLPCSIDQDGRWEDPLPRFIVPGAALGHVHADPGPLDSTSRQIPLEKAAGKQRRWALALEAFRLAAGGGAVLESPEELEVAGVAIPARRSNARAMRIRYLPPLPGPASPIPQVSFKQLLGTPGLAERFRGRVVFVGMTAQSAVRDRMMTPYDTERGTAMPGVELHANAFETILQRQFLVSAPDSAVAGLTLLMAAAGVFTFVLLSGWQAYAVAAALLALAHTAPYLFFTYGVVTPYFGPVLAAWLSVVGAGSFQFLSVRRQLRKAEAEKARYQQAMHFVTHEMRTPLTAIQGSSELMGRYNLTEEKRKQIAGLINTESKRLAKMIETFLNVERLSAGQMNLRKEPFAVGDVVNACVQRAAPLAERKRIGIDLAPLPDITLTGDRELMEYAVYNLLTNAVKYSPAETRIDVLARSVGDRLHLSVKDQGIGMDQQELRKIFTRFYRTRRAQATGEAGVGIGLSIVEQIVAQHGGRIEVASEPGNGTCFTLVLPVAA